MAASITVAVFPAHAGALLLGPEPLAMMFLSTTVIFAIRRCCGTGFLGCSRINFITFLLKPPLIEEVAAWKLC